LSVVGKSGGVCCRERRRLHGDILGVREGGFSGRNPKSGRKNIRTSQGKGYSDRVRYRSDNWDLNNKENKRKGKKSGSIGGVSRKVGKTYKRGEPVIKGEENDWALKTPEVQGTKSRKEILKGKLHSRGQKEPLHRGDKYMDKKRTSKP